MFHHFADATEHLRTTDADTLRASDAGGDEDQLFTTDSVIDAIAWTVEAVRDVDANVQDAGRTLTAGTGGAGVLVTGSITLVGQVRDLLGAETEQTDASVDVEGLDDLSAFFTDQQEDDDE